MKIFQVPGPRRAVIAVLMAAVLSTVQPGLAADPGRVVFFGDSLTIGYGVEPSEAYPALIQAKIDALKLPFRVVNAGLSGDTTAAGERRIRWLLREPADVLVIALGSNDGLRGLPPESTRDNLQRLIDSARKAQPGIAVVLCGMQMPPNYGAAYTRRFAAVFPALARKNGLPFVPFLLDGVGGVPDLNLSDGIHPNSRGHRVLAETVWKTLRPVLLKRSSPASK